MYSEHGLDALIRSVFGQVCQWLTVVSYCSPGPPSVRLDAVPSCSTLQLMISAMSGWSALRITILAARRFLRPDLITPAKASKPVMKETGPDAVPPPARRSREERSGERFVPVPEPYLNSIPSVLARVRIDSILSSTLLIKQAES